MESRHLQMLLASCGHYDGGIDGVLGPKTRAAIRAVEAKHEKAYTFSTPPPLSRTAAKPPPRRPA
jgi:peptidoglycan hydrolase-like protein with peptidoglycan-binding domain